ncbi:MAG TPA: hypothetical protein VLA93_13545 [Pyrinomonadaceae bacterium]|nr:hypothetical protein [Pyrinomonadaceae bacterium]
MAAVSVNRESITWFDAIASGRELASDSRRQSIEKGFVVVPGPVSDSEMVWRAHAYDLAIWYLRIGIG